MHLLPIFYSSALFEKSRIFRKGNHSCKSALSNFTKNPFFVTKTHYQQDYHRHHHETQLLKMCTLYSGVSDVYSVSDEDIAAAC